MSDSPSEQRSMEAALRRCSGGIMCRCDGQHSPRSSASRTRSSNHGSDGSGDSSHGNGGSASSDSASESNSSMPLALPEQEWSGLGVVRLPKCTHDRHAVLKKCWGGKNSMRRFLGCPIEEHHERCNFMEWMDEAWPDRVQHALKKMWDELKLWRHIESFSHEEMIAAMKQTEALKKEKEKYKKVAEEACGILRRREAYATVDKCKLMWLVYALLGVIALQLGLIFAIMNK